MAPAATAAPRPPLTARLRSYFSEGPFSNARFLFFIFMLLPVRTLFAHQWLTMPEYILRSYSPEVGDRMEWLVNWINPLDHFLWRAGGHGADAAVPRLHDDDRRFAGLGRADVPALFRPEFDIVDHLLRDVLDRRGALVCPFPGVCQRDWPRLAGFPSTWVWPKYPGCWPRGRPGFYSGLLLAKYCPANTPPADLHTDTLWLIYAAIAMTSPLGLWLARGWVQRGLHNPVHEPVEVPPTVE